MDVGTLGVLADVLVPSAGDPPLGDEVPPEHRPEVEGLG